MNLRSKGKEVVVSDNQKLTQRSLSGAKMDRLKDENLGDSLSKLPGLLTLPQTFFLKMGVPSYILTGDVHS